MTDRTYVRSHFRNKPERHESVEYVEEKPRKRGFDFGNNFDFGEDFLF